MSESIQKNVAKYLRELADKVEKSSYSQIDACTDERKYVTLYKGRGFMGTFPTGTREVTLKLNYTEERL